MSEQPVLILGMHRSGTSCLAGSLQEAGLWLGNVVEQASHNAKGNRERLEVMDLHNRVLSSNRGAWNEPPADVRWTQQQLAERDAFIESMPTDQAWGLKDPRTLLTLDAWVEALPDVRLVGSFRHPLAVAASLKARDLMGVDQAIHLWSHYNAKLLGLVEEGRITALVDFDQPAQEYAESLKDVARRLRLPATPMEFFDVRLRHHGMPSRSMEIPAETDAIYQGLLASL